MNKLILTLVAMLTCVSTYAGEPRLSIWGAYSYGKGVSEVGSGKPTSVWYKLLGSGCVFRDPDRGRSAVTLGIDYRVTGGLYLGVSWTTGAKFSEVDNDNPAKSLCSKATYKTSYLLFSIKYQWLKINNFRLYSRTAIGIGFIFDMDFWFDDSWLTIENIEIKTKRGPSEKVAWEVAPLGVEYKPYRFMGIFAEGGFGNQGNLLAGIRFYPL